jgi:hypothetical protein
LLCIVSSVALQLKRDSMLKNVLLQSEVMLGKDLACGLEVGTLLKSVLLRVF